MRFRYLKWDPQLLDWLKQFKSLFQLFNYLLLKSNGDVEQAMEWMRYLQQRGVIDPEADLEEFFEQLEEQRIVQRTEAGMHLGPRGEWALRKQAFKAIFDGLKQSLAGGHPTPYEGPGGEPLPETRPYEFGDDFRQIDFRASFQNALRRGSLQLHEQDLEVHETEFSTSCATALLLDISHSMILYGEDRITPAKQVALALTELILSEYPRDSLTVIVFGDEAWEVAPGDLPYLSVGPYHTNTQAALALARTLLLRKKMANRQIFMITDGKPTVVVEPDGRIYRNTWGLDPHIVSRTLDEALLCRRHQIPITTFMLARDYDLQDFIRNLTRLNRGRAYFSSLDYLGEYVLLDFIRNRQRRVR